MQAKDGEDVDFPSPCDLNGQVEVWLNRLLDKQCATVLHWLTDAVAAYEEKSREQWILDFPGQIALTGSQIWWTTEVNIAFAKLEEGFENALKDYDRQKVMTICTIDVHARDVVTKMITNKVNNINSNFIIIQHFYQSFFNLIFINNSNFYFNQYHIFRLKILVNSYGNVN
jgi:dynein heavy chain